MKLATLALTASMFSGLAFAPQSPSSQSSPTARETRELTDVFPADLKIDPKVDVFSITADGQRTYFGNSAGEVWVFDHTRKTREKVVTGPVWDLNVSPAGNALAYTKGGEHRGDAFVWVLALNPSSGLAAGAEKQISPRQGDAPSLSPDGKLLAFARDDASGVGQSIAIVPIGGGAERVTAQALPSSVTNIRWTPDGKSLYFGVNPPVACVPEWSCLPLNQDLRQPPGSIRKVAVAGGSVTTVASARGFTPGLSPDGTTLMFLENATTRRWIIANADGTQRDALTLPMTDAPVGWLKGSTLILASGAPRGVRSIDLSAAGAR
jgi:Tol biopolymer transport system component